MQELVIFDNIVLTEAAVCLFSVKRVFFGALLTECSCGVVLDERSTGMSETVEL
jgi:hypothetical protein